MKVWLDDVRNPNNYNNNNWIWVKNVEDCIKILIHNPVEVLSLDHDLGEDVEDIQSFDCKYSLTGYEVCRFLVEEYQANDKNYFPPLIYVHTANPIGGENMMKLLNRYKPDNVQIVRVNLR